MENEVKIAFSSSVDTFNRPVAGMHKLIVHITSTYIALLAVTTEKKKVTGFQQLEYQDSFRNLDASLAQSILNRLITNHEWFSDPEVQVSLLLPGNGFTLVPSALYDPYARELLLESQYQLQPGDMVFAENSDNSSFVSVYALPWSWGQPLRSHFRDVKLLHEDSCWIKLAQSEQGKNLTERAVILYVENDKVKIFIEGKEKLLFFNSFDCHSEHDVLYYLQLGLTKCERTAASSDIFLAGSNCDDPGFHTFLKQYVSSVNTVKFPFFLSLPVSLRKIIPSRYLALFSTVVCG